MKRVLFLLAVLSVVACTKVDIKHDYPYLSGDYDWLGSSDTSGNSYLNSNTSDHYRLRIKDHSRILMYKNGQKIYREVIYSLEDLTDTIIIVSGKGHKELCCTIVNNVLTTSSQPYAGFINTFVKVN